MKGVESREFSLGGGDMGEGEGELLRVQGDVLQKRVMEEEGLIYGG